MISRFSVFDMDSQEFGCLITFGLSNFAMSNYRNYGQQDNSTEICM